LAAGGALDVGLVVLGGAIGRVVAVAAAGAAAVELDAIAGPRDAVALASAARRPLDTDEGDELLDDRDVSDGTSESASLSKSESSTPPESLG